MIPCLRVSIAVIKHCDLNTSQVEFIGALLPGLFHMACLACFLIDSIHMGWFLPINH